MIKKVKLTVENMRQYLDKVIDKEAREGIEAGLPLVDMWEAGGRSDDDLKDAIQQVLDDTGEVSIEVPDDEEKKPSKGSAKSSVEKEVEKKLEQQRKKEKEKAAKAAEAEKKKPFDWKRVPNVVKFMPKHQLMAVKQFIRGEEKQFFIDTMLELEENFKQAHKKQKGSDNPMLWIRYFNNFKKYDSYVIDADEDEGEMMAYFPYDEFEEHYQMLYVGTELFEYSRLQGGYEIDFHFTPCRLNDLLTRIGKEEQIHNSMPAEDFDNAADDDVELDDEMEDWISKVLYANIWGKINESQKQNIANCFVKIEALKNEVWQDQIMYTTTVFKLQNGVRVRLALVPSTYGIDISSEGIKPSRCCDGGVSATFLIEVDGKTGIVHEFFDPDAYAKIADYVDKYCIGQENLYPFEQESIADTIYNIHQYRLIKLSEIDKLMAGKSEPEDEAEDDAEDDDIETVEKPNSDTKPKTKKSATNKAEKAKPVKRATLDNAKAVASVDTEVALIKRYCGLHGKTLNADTRKKALNTLKALQKAIVERKIRKTSKYATEIMNMQRSLIKVDDIANGAKIEIDGIDNYLRIANSQKRNSKVDILKKLIGKLCTAPDMATAEKLLKAAKKAKPKGENVTRAIKALQRYVDGETSIIMATEAQLEGLAGIL